MALQIGLPRTAVVGKRSEEGLVWVTPTVAYLRTAIVNVAFIRAPFTDEWVLVDTGMPGSARRIARCAERAFGKPPSAIVLTHGHFDHTGAVEQLSAAWNVPVFANRLEFPYLNGTAYYPSADPRVGGGAMAWLSPLYPRSPVKLGTALRALPDDRTVPPLPRWRWIFTPGHSTGHTSLWEPEERTLVAGDALITTGQESLLEVLAQTPELHGPPRYLTTDWLQSEASVAALACLEPETLVSGHGPALQGETMRTALARLSNEFGKVAVPEVSRYLKYPANAELGNAYVQR